MKTFTTFTQPAGWPSIASAYQDDFAAGERIQASPWGGLAILGHAELSELARHPSADGMAPAAEDMAATPRLYELLMGALFTKSGNTHREGRAASIAAFRAVDVPAIIRQAVSGLPDAVTGHADIRSGIVAPLVRQAWAGIIGYTPEEARRLERAVEDMSHILSPSPDLSKADIAGAAAAEAISLSRNVCNRGSPYTASLSHAVGVEAAAHLIAGMAFDAIETSITGLTAALRIAAAHRDQLGATPQCANECLRLASPAPMTLRMTTAPITFRGIDIPVATPLFMVWAAGNHDPQAFPEPERFSPRRQSAQPLVFGAGQHACLGHAIARPLLQALLAFIIERNVMIYGGDGPWNILLPADMPQLQANW